MDGYARYTHHPVGEIKRKVNAHSLVLELTLGRPLLVKRRACHRCDIPSCVNPDHLWEGTDAENARDSMTKGRRARPRGEANGGHKLTENAVREIRKAAGPHRDIAARFGISTAAVSMIRARKSWSHLPDEKPETPPGASPITSGEERCN